MSSKSTTLVKKVFDGYNPAVIPRCPNKEQVNVKLTIALIQILNVVRSFDSDFECGESFDSDFKCGKIFDSDFECGEIFD